MLAGRSLELEAGEIFLQILHMAYRPKIGVFLIALIAAAMIAPVDASEVYTWIDESGVTHFSQWPPDRFSPRVNRIEIEPTNPSDYDPHADPYSIQNQAKRINASWLAFEEKRAVQAAARRQAEAQRAERAAYLPSSSYEPHRHYLGPILFPFRRQPFFGKHGINTRIPGIQHRRNSGPRNIFDGRDARHPPRPGTVGGRPARALPARRHDMRWAPPPPPPRPRVREQRLNAATLITAVH